MGIVECDITLECEDTSVSGQFASTCICTYTAIKWNGKSSPVQFLKGLVLGELFKWDLY